jgi:hypothetical protein
MKASFSKSASRQDKTDDSRSITPVAPSQHSAPDLSRFTLDGSQVLERHLAGICDGVLTGVKEIIPTSKLDALVLGGGYGRGEGGVLRTDAGDRPYNDLEFYVFVRGNRQLNGRKFRRPLELLGERISPKAQLHVEFKVDSLNHLRRSQVTMYSYDLLAGHRVLWPKDERSVRQLFVGCEHHLDAAKIPLQEAARLLLNRFTGLLLAKERLQQTDLPFEDSDFVGRNLAKAQLAMGDAVLAAHGRYHWSCIERSERLRQLQAPANAPWFADVQRHHRSGVEFKLHPRQIFKTSHQLRREHQEISNLALTLWLWLESRRLNRTFGTIREYTLDRVEKCVGTSAFRNLLLNLNAFGPESLFDRMATYYPRERLLNSLPLLLWEEPLNDVRVKYHLRNQLRTAAEDWKSFVSAYKSIWANFS